MTEQPDEIVVPADEVEDEVSDFDPDTTEGDEVEDDDTDHSEVEA